MNGLLTIIILVEAVALIFLGLLVLTRDNKNYVNITFFIMATLGSIWVPLAYFGGNVGNLDVSRTLIKADYAVGFLVIWSFWLFSRKYLLSISKPKKRDYEIKMLRLSLVAAIAVSSLAFMPSLLEFTATNNNVAATESLLFSLIYTSSAGAFFVFGIRNLYKARSAASVTSRSKVNLIFYSLLGTVVVVGLPFVVAGFLFSDEFDISVLQQLSILGFFIFISGTAYAIARHQLFDIRAAIARSVAYISSLGTMLVIYVVLIFGVTGVFLDNSTIDSTQKFIYAVFAVLIAFTFQPLKNFFDKLTDKIFYRDKYNSEEILSDYTDFLVDEIDTEKVISRTLTLVNDIANPDSSLVVLYKEGVGDWHDVHGSITGDDRDELAKALEYQAGAVYVADVSSAKADPFLENINTHMNSKLLKVSIRLSTHGQLEGFILLGDKKSGSRYTQKDLNFFATIANELSVSLQNSQRFDQIQRFNVTLQREVDEATAQLKLTNKKLKQLDTAKDEFISMASHQLRTPLTAVKGYVSMVMDGDAGKVTEEQKKLLGEAFSSSQRMVYLIADLLNVSRIKTGKFVIEPVEVDLGKMVKEEVDQLKATATTRHILIKFSPPSSFPKLMLDATKTRQVVMNFIDNAIYYTKGGGDVKVTIVAKKDHIEYRVKDTGIGIPSADQHKLFTKFFRAGNAKKARPDGTGLGLYMAQKIIAAQGGSVIFKSKEGKGSTFGFNLPI